MNSPSGLSDQAERNRFVEGHARNISVIAPAGVGKTTSIVERIVHIARLGETEAADRLTRLVVVTYSVRAAQQMRQRARVAIRDANVAPSVRRAFQRTFFGTIHSYCVRLLERFGHYLGLPSPVGLIEGDEEIWPRFLLRGLPAGFADDPNLRELFHFFPPEKLYGLGKIVSPGAVVESRPLPELKWAPLLDYPTGNFKGPTRAAVERAQKAARTWSESWGRGERHHPLPKETSSTQAEEFIAIWRQTFAPLHEWLKESAHAFGRRVANAYEAYRLSEALMTYEDQVRLALRVLDIPETRQELAEERVSVLLDEAQDTDPLQFEVLRRVAGLGPAMVQAEDQSFSIVGDFQQAIYAPRSDLSAYRLVHDEITVEPRGAKSVLTVTFRCDAAIIDFVNKVFPTVLDEGRGQSAFVKLFPRPGAGPGQVLRWACPEEPRQALSGKLKADERARHEAQFIAERLGRLGPGGLGASDWAQVAILCPRIKWLQTLQLELHAQGLPVQLHSSDEERRERTPAAWLSALIWVAAHPEDNFEIAGVLREIFGVADSDMAKFTAGDGDRLRLCGTPPHATGTVAAALTTLRDACAGADAAPVSRVIERLLEKTRLRARLNSIPELIEADRDLDDFLEGLAARSADGATLAELAHDTRLSLRQGHPAQDEIRNAVQLLTSYKAKGLEWQAVIVPFVFREIQARQTPYPRMVMGADRTEMILRDKSDFAGEFKEFFTERERQQFQRLYYVAATRAQRTLIWIDDEVLYASGKDWKEWVAGKFLGFAEGGGNRGVWRALNESGAGVEVAVTPAEAMQVETLATVALSAEDVRQAVRNAENFPHRVTPHALAVHARTEAEPERGAELEDDTLAATGPGVLYGTWWHEFVQKVPWSRPKADWQAAFLSARGASPDTKRAARDWQRFLASELALELAAPNRLIQVELPFLWRSEENLWVEGIMDLAIFDTVEERWQVVDWKTNRVGAGGAAALVAIYRGQIRAYVRALADCLSAEVRGSLYLTETGDWVPVD